MGAQNTRNILDCPTELRWLDATPSVLTHSPPVTPAYPAVGLDGLVGWMDWLKLKETYVHLERLLHMLAGIQNLQHRHANICCWLALCGIVKKRFFACRSGDACEDVGRHPRWDCLLWHGVPDHAHAAAAGRCTLHYTMICQHCYTCGTDTTTTTKLGQGHYREDKAQLQLGCLHAANHTPLLPDQWPAA